MKIVSQSPQGRWLCASLVATVWSTIGIAPAHSFDPPPGEGTPVRTVGGSTRSGRDAGRTQPSIIVPAVHALGPQPWSMTILDG
jgi:hypothetical protein